MPAGVAFLIIGEGTDEFTAYMKELSSGTIWEKRSSPWGFLNNFPQKYREVNNWLVDYGL